MVADHIRKAAVEVGVLMPGEKVRFGAHNLRHSLATFLVALKCDPKTVQGLLRHSNVTTTLELYSHGRNQDRSDAQAAMLDAFLKPATNAVQ
jgi:integrase